MSAGKRKRESKQKEDTTVKSFELAPLVQLARSDAADVTLSVGIDGDDPTDIQFSRLVLAAQSPVFRAMFYGSMSEAKQNAIVPVAFPVQAVQAFLDAMCSGNIQVEDPIALDVYRMADFYQVPALKNVVADYITEHLSGENALTSLSNLGEGELRTVCLTYIKRHATECFEGHRVESLAQHELVELLQLDLNINEFELFQAVVRWGKAHCRQISSSNGLLDKIAPLMEHVRFPLMEFHQLTEEVEPTGLVKQELLYEALLGKHKRSTPQGIRFRKRCQSISLHFPEPSEGRSHSSLAEGDMHGLFYYLGSNGGASEYKNPCIDGVVSVRWSSVCIGEPLLFVGLQHRLDTSSYTGAKPASWMQVDLGQRYRFIPNRYALRDGIDSTRPSTNNVLRNWSLEGREAETDQWTVLRSHVNDTALTHTLVVSWAIIDCRKAFRFFRLLQTGPNSNGADYLLCSGFELWGDLLENP